MKPVDPRWSWVWWIFAVIGAEVLTALLLASQAH